MRAARAARLFPAGDFLVLRSAAPAVSSSRVSNAPDAATPPSLGDYLLDVQRRDIAVGDFVLEAPDVLAVKIDGRLRVRASAVLAATGQVRVTPASRFAGIAGKDASGGVLAALDGKGRAWLGEAGKTAKLLKLKKDESLAVAPHAVLAIEDTVAFVCAPVKIPAAKPIELPTLILKGPGRIAVAACGTLHAVRVSARVPLFVRVGATVAWTANLDVVGRAGTTGDTRLAFSGEGYVMIQAGDRA